MKKIIIISSALFITVLSGIGYISYKNINFNNKVNNTEIIEEEKENKPISEKVEKENTENIDSQSDNKVEEKSEKTVNEEEQSTKIPQDNSSNQTTKKAEINTKKEIPVSKKQEAAIGVVDPEGNNRTIDTVKSVDSEPWVKAGVSKDDYYNKPVYSWARIDYPVSQCKSLKECESLCMKDAEPLSYTENVSCIEIYTYSGTYLGEMLKEH